MTDVQKKGSKGKKEEWKLGLPESRLPGSSSTDIMAKIIAQMKGKPEPPKPPPAPEPLRVPQLSPIIDPSVKDRISGDEFLKSQGKFEVEASFGTYKPNGKFVPGVSATQFSSLMKVMKQMKIKNILTLATYVDKVEIMESEFARRITDSETGTSVWEKKARYTKQSIENKVWGYRISKSEEKFEGPSIPEDKFSPDLIRYRTRHSFQVSKSESDIYGYQIDMTHVHEVHFKKEKTFRERTPSEKSKEWWAELEEGEVPEEEVETVSEEFSIIKYEVEIERNKAIASKFEGKPKSPINLQSFTNILKLILISLQSAGNDKQLLTLPERQAATTLHNDLFARDIREIEAKKKKITIAPFRLWKDYWNKPTNIRIDDFLNKFVNDYAITLKLDGVRRFVFLTNTATYSAGPPDDLWKIGLPTIEYHNTLLDTEMYEDENGGVTYYVFDILFYKGRDIRGSRLMARLDLVKDVTKYMADTNLLFDANLEMKEFITEGSFYDRSNKAFKMSEQSNLRLDGLIFQPGNWYRNNHTRKWKPSSLMTIDFKLQRRGPLGEDVFNLLVGGHRGEEIVFKGSSRHPFTGGYIVVEDGKFEDVSVNGVIAECKWNSEENTFEIYRLREDRDKPNALKTALDVWEDIHNPISVQTIMGNTLQVMRRYHNIVKGEMLQAEFEKSSIIMDWGSGRGGDLKKWEDAGLSKVFVVEPNETNLEELERRLEEMKEKGYDPDRVQIVRDSSQNLVGGQATQELINAIGGTTLNGITAFFSLTYFGKDPETFTAMIESVDSLLSDGGKFVGIVMDGDKVRNALEISKTESGFDEEEAAIITKSSFEIAQVSAYSDSIEEDKNEIEISITDPTSMVKNQQEWLFYFGVLERELSDRNIVLLKTGFLDKGQTYDVLPADSKAFSEFNRYFVFQKSAEGKKTTREKKEVGEKKPSKIEIKEKPKKYVEVGVDSLVDFPNIYDIDLYRVGVINDKSSFIHAVVRAFYTKYYDMAEKERIDYAKKIRKMMSRTATDKIYNQLNNGELEAAYTSKAMEDLDDETSAKLVGFQNYRLNVLDSTTFIGQQEGLELLSTLLSINILVLDSSSKPIVRLYGRDITGARELASMYAKTIVLVTADNIRYSLVTKKLTDDSVYTVFDTEDKFIQDILNESYPLMSEEFEGEEYEGIW